MSINKRLNSKEKDAQTFDLPLYYDDYDTAVEIFWTLVELAHYAYWHQPDETEYLYMAEQLWAEREGLA